MNFELLEKANGLFEFSRDLRRDLHKHPELGFREVRTANIVAQELKQLGLEVTTGVAETGVIGLLHGSRSGPTVLLRFDMDALPIQEETGLEFASEVQGVMHACGHDGHVAVGLTVARILSSERQNFKGTFKFMFQPAEEGLGGAAGMIAAGVLENPRVDAALALHLWNERPVGWTAVVPGPFMAGADIFSIQIKGKGGHGAIPDQATDPVIAAAEMISSIQSIVSRNISPLDAAVVSVTQVTAGNAFNIIPPEANIRGTIRSFEKEVRDLVLTRLENLVKGIAVGFGCEAQLEIQQLTPAVVNDPKITILVEQAIKTSLPDTQLDHSYHTMVSEDMAFVLQKVPGCYVFTGSGGPDPALNYGHHHPKFTIDERVLPRAAAGISAAALGIIERL